MFTTKHNINKIIVNDPEMTKENMLSPFQTLQINGHTYTVTIYTLFVIYTVCKEYFFQHTLLNRKLAFCLHNVVITIINC